MLIYVAYKPHRKYTITLLRSDGCVILNTTIMICSYLLYFSLYAYEIYCRAPVLPFEIITISFHLPETCDLSDLCFFKAFSFAILTTRVQIANWHLTQHRPLPTDQGCNSKAPLCVSNIGYPPQP